MHLDFTTTFSLSRLCHSFIQRQSCSFLDMLCIFWRRVELVSYYIVTLVLWGFCFVFWLYVSSIIMFGWFDSILRVLPWVLILFYISYHFGWQTYLSRLSSTSAVMTLGFSIVTLLLYTWILSDIDIRHYKSLFLVDDNFQ